MLIRVNCNFLSFKSLFVLVNHEITFKQVIFKILTIVASLAQLAARQPLNLYQKCQVSEFDPPARGKILTTWFQSFSFFLLSLLNMIWLFNSLFSNCP